MFYALTFVLILVFGTIAAFISNPAFAFVMYELVYFFAPKLQWWGNMLPGLGYSFLTVIVMLLATGYNFKKVSKNKVSQSPQLLWMYIAILLYGVTYINAVFPAGHASAAINFVKLGIIITMAYKLISTDKTLDYAIWGYLLGCFYISTVVFEVGRNSGNRVEGVGTVDAPDANGIASVLAPSLVMLLYYFIFEKKIHRKLGIAFMGAFIANALILINSRGAYLATAISIMFFMKHIFGAQKVKHQKAIAIFLVLFGVAGLSVLIDDSFIQRVESIFAEKEVDYERETASTRTVFWSAAVDMAVDHPLGSGYLGFDYYAPYYLPEELATGRTRNRSVHSTWFEVLTEIGFLGFVIFLLLLRSCYVTLQKCKKKLLNDKEFQNWFKVLSIESAFVAFIIAMTFINRFRAEILYWLVLYSAVAYNIYILKPSSVKKD